MSFKDHFSGQAKGYSQYRPGYPRELFDYLIKPIRNRETAWDCATGNGQAALVLTDYFDQVMATDASSAQIDQAVPHPKVHYQVASAEHSGLADSSIHLITVAQALHWFDFDLFYEEVRRVAKPEAYLAAWTYGLFRCEPAIDNIIDRFYYQEIHPYWPPERAHVESRYQTIPFPFQQLDDPGFTINRAYALDDFVNYIGTWSAVKEFRLKKGENPLETVKEDLLKVWGDPAQSKMLTWPIHLLMGKI